MTVNRAFLSSFLHHQGTYLQVITLTDTSLPAGPVLLKQRQDNKDAALLCHSGL